MKDKKILIQEEQSNEKMKERGEDFLNSVLLYHSTNMLNLLLELNLFNILNR